MNWRGERRSVEEVKMWLYVLGAWLNERVNKERASETERWNHKVLLVCLDRLLVSRAWIGLWRGEVNLLSAAVLN